MKIIKETLATRCEICHRTDLFCPEKQECLRCEKVRQNLKTTEPTALNKERRSIIHTLLIGYNLGVLSYTLVICTDYFVSKKWHLVEEWHYPSYSVIMLVVSIISGIIFMSQFTKIKSWDRALQINKVSLTILFAQFGMSIALNTKQTFHPEPFLEFSYVLVGASLGFLLSVIKPLNECLVKCCWYADLKKEVTKF